MTPAGSNYTFLSELKLGDRTQLAIYKPRDGEAPLWDFPRGHFVQERVRRLPVEPGAGLGTSSRIRLSGDGPYGIGSVQRFVHHDPKQNYYTLTEDHASELRLIACFDLVANSTDRKANHLLVGADGKLWSIDHGLTFHEDMKVRTVIWDFCGRTNPQTLSEHVAGPVEAVAVPQRSVAGNAAIVEHGRGGIAATTDRLGIDRGGLSGHTGPVAQTPPLLTG